MEKANVTAPVHHERFKDAVWYGESRQIVVGGAGGIGSWLTFFLNRIGHHIYVYDNDIVEEVNLAGQLYGPLEIGMNKGEAAIQVNRALSGSVKINSLGKFTDDIHEIGSSIVSNITMMGFDNMAARKLMAEKWYAHQLAKPEKIPNEINILIDGRMDAESGMLFIVKSVADYKRYMSQDMFPDSDVPDGSCTHKATSHNGARLAQEMVNVMNNYIVNRTKGRNYRSVPYKIEYEFPTLGYETTYY